MKPVVKRVFVVKSRDKSKIKDLLKFSEYRLFGTRVKVVGISTKSSSRIAELSIETLMDSFRGEGMELYDF